MARKMAKLLAEYQKKYDAGKIKFDVYPSEIRELIEISYPGIYDPAPDGKYMTSRDFYGNMVEMLANALYCGYMVGYKACKKDLDRECEKKISKPDASKKETGNDKVPKR